MFTQFYKTHASALSRQLVHLTRDTPRLPTSHPSPILDSGGPSISEMASWSTLPPEIRHRILHFYCEDLINQYDKTFVKLGGFGDKTMYDFLSSPLSAPEPLMNFHSIILTDR